VFNDIELQCDQTGEQRRAKPGDYVRVFVDSTGVTTLQGQGQAITTLSGFEKRNQSQ